MWGVNLMQTKESPPRALTRAGLMYRDLKWPAHQDDQPQDRAHRPGSQAHPSWQREIQWSQGQGQRDTLRTLFPVRRSALYQWQEAMAAALAPLSFPPSVSVRRTEMGYNARRVFQPKECSPFGVFPGNGRLVDAAIPIRPGPHATTKERSYKARASQARRKAHVPATGCTSQGNRCA